MITVPNQVLYDVPCVNNVEVFSETATDIPANKIDVLIDYCSLKNGGFRIVIVWRKS